MLRIALCAAWLVPVLLACQDKPQEATISRILLDGKHDRMVSGARVEIDAKEGEAVLKARWTTDTGRSYSLEAKLSADDWKSLAEDIAKAGKLSDVDLGVSHGTNWSLTLTTGESTMKYRARAPDRRDDEPLSKVIFGLLKCRDQHLAYARLDEPRDEGTMRIKDTARTARVLISSEARRKAEFLKKGEFLSPMEVLAAGQYRNREIVEALVSLLDHKDPVIASAACAPLSWHSGENPTSDKAMWNAWWAKAKESYRPRVEGHGTGRVGAGTVRALAGYGGGLDCIDVDAEGAIWAIVEHERDLLQLQLYDAEKDTFSPVGDEHSCDRDGRIKWSPRFSRQVVRSRMELPRSRWADTNRAGEIGVVVVGSRGNEFDFEAVLRIDFKSGTKEHLPLKHRQVAYPIISDDGTLFAVAEAEGWANPNWVAIYDSKGELVALPEIEREHNLNPIGFAKGKFFFERHSDRDDANLEIWTYEQETKAVEKLAEYAGKERFSRGPMTDDGRMVIRRGGMGALKLGFLDLKSKVFSPVSPDVGEIDDVSISADGARVVFLADGEPFEWTKK